MPCAHYPLDYEDTSFLKKIMQYFMGAAFLATQGTKASWWTALVLTKSARNIPAALPEE